MQELIQYIKINFAVIVSIVTMGCLIWSNLENRKSRQFQYRPHLVFQKHQERTYLFEHEIDTCDFKQLFTKHFDGNIEWIPLVIKNIGVGFAKDIEVYLDYSEIVDELVKREIKSEGLYYSKDMSFENSYGINSFLDVDVCDYYDYKNKKKTKSHYFNTLTVGEESELYLSIHINLLGFICMLEDYRCKNVFKIPYRIEFKSIDEKKITQNGFLRITFSDKHDIGVSHIEFNKQLNHLVNDGVDIKKEIPLVNHVNTISIISDSTAFIL